MIIRQRQMRWYEPERQLEGYTNDLARYGASDFVAPPGTTLITPGTSGNGNTNLQPGAGSEYGPDVPTGAQWAAMQQKPTDWGWIIGLVAVGAAVWYYSRP